MKNLLTFEEFVNESKLNEGSYDDFMIENGKLVKSLLNDLAKIAKKIDSGKLGEDQVGPVLDKIESIYDKEVFKLIDRILFGLTNVTVNDVADVAVEISNNHGTDMQQVANAMEDVVTNRKLK
jgi:hypothetical protein